MGIQGLPHTPLYKAQNGGVADTRPKSRGFHKYGMRKDTRKFPSGRETLTELKKIITSLLHVASSN